MKTNACNSASSTEATALDGCNGIIIFFFFIIALISFRIIALNYYPLYSYGANQKEEILIIT